MRFEFATAARIVFGYGTVEEVAPAARQMGKRALLVTGRRVERASGLRSRLEAAGLEVCLLPVPGEPTVDLVREGTRLARERECELVISFGGGSAIDAGKAIAGMATNEGDLLDYLEVVGRGRPLEKPGLPFIAVPTTAGTGAEVTRNAVIAAPEHGVKASLRSPLLLARLAVVDPQLTLGVPPEVTAATGMDALTQLIEPYVSLRANPMMDPLCLDGIRRVSRSLTVCFRQPENRLARTDMALASLFSGLALANAGLGAVHGLAAAIGGRFAAPHGAVCAALLAEVMEANIRALRRLGSQATETLGRYSDIASALTGNGGARPEDGVEAVRKLRTELGIKPLSEYGVQQEHLPSLAEAGLRASSMKANPAQLTREELEAVLHKALSR